MPINLHIYVSFFHIQNTQKIDISFNEYGEVVHKFSEGFLKVS